MKHVHKESMVAHLWANKSQDNARNSRNTFYFTERTIYSYGQHFPIARHVTVGRGATERKCIFFTTEERSVTTSAHISMVRQALRGDVPVFYVPGIHSIRGKRNKREFQHKMNLASYRERISSAAKNAIKARGRKQEWICTAQATVDEANRYAAFFKLRSLFIMPTEMDLKAELEKAERAKKLREKKRAAADAAQIVLDMEKMEEWKSGNDVYIGGLYGVNKVYLRVVHGLDDNGLPDDILETSKGAEVPLKHAIRLLPIIRCGREYKRNGHSEHVGKFVVDHITAEGNVKIGCHFVERDEIERIAAQLGL